MNDLGKFTNAQLCERLDSLVAADNEVNADIIECLVHVIVRRLYLVMGYSCLRSFCVGRFGFSEDVAYKRGRVAQLAARRPEVIGFLRQGRISLSGLVAVAPHVDDCPGLLERALDKSSRAIEALVAAERPD